MIQSAQLDHEANSIFHRDKLWQQNISPKLNEYNSNCLQSCRRANLWTWLREQPILKPIEQSIYCWIEKQISREYISGDTKWWIYILGVTVRWFITFSTQQYRDTSGEIDFLTNSILSQLCLAYKSMDSGFIINSSFDYKLTDGYRTHGIILYHRQSSFQCGMFYSRHWSFKFIHLLRRRP